MQLKKEIPLSGCLSKPLTYASQINGNLSNLPLNKSTALQPVYSINPLHRPELDTGFLPASLWIRSYERKVDEIGSRPVTIALLRPDGTGTRHLERLLPARPEWQLVNLRHLERIVKFLLWGQGGNRLLVSGAPDLVEPLRKIYSHNGQRAFDVDFSRRLFGSPLTIQSIDEGNMPTFGNEEGEITVSQRADGNRIGFDLGGSDRKCAAVIDGKVVFSEEIAWDPYFESNPAYHLEGIRDSLKRAAAHLPSVDAIGGSAAGLYVDNQVRVASLFRGVPDEIFDSHVKNMFLDIAREWGDVPFRVANDGDVTALAGAMSLDMGAVMGLSMGTSTACGYANESGGITNRITELAFAPIDYRQDAPADEWSGDLGCQVQYFSQQAVSRLIPASGLPIDHELSKPEQLIEVQTFMKAGDERAAKIYNTIGTYLGYAIPHCSRFYHIRHLLLLGRVMSGAGGEMIISAARNVLDDEFPEMSASIGMSTPNENLKRHGQAIAAACLPKITRKPK